jgi:small GTP-binding protein
MVSINASPTLTRRLLEAKLVVAGQGSVGKTSLVKCLTDGTFNPAENKTEGIEIKQFDIVNSSNETIRLNIWNFGGQEIMHATHQFFLTKRSLYLLVLDSRLTQEENRVEYWLKIIESYSGDSPILIAGNKIDQHPLDIDRTGLQKKYPSIVGFFETSAATGAGIELLKAAIVDQVSKLPHVRDLYPESWLTIKSKLEKMGRESNFITHDNYLELCAKNEVTDELSQKTLIGFLHDLGVVLHFQDDPRLEALGVLNPQWITNGVYKIINSHVLFRNKGVLTLSMLDEILDMPEYPRGKRLFIVDMMMKFELCYELESGKSFLVPDLLPKDEPYIGDWAGTLYFQYAYDVLPSSIITRFIVRMNSYIFKDTVWRSGVVLILGKSQSLVRSDFEDRTIVISIKGDNTQDALAAIRNQFEEIHYSIKGLKVVSKIPLPEYPQVEPLDYDFLLQLVQKGVSAFPVNAGEKIILINVEELLDRIETGIIRKAPKFIDDVSIQQDKRKIDLPAQSFIETNKRIRVITDQPTGPDKLKFSRYADAFADLIANPEMNTPITIGVYGKWGSGKSFLMGKIKEAIKKPRAKWRWYDARGILQQFGAKKPELDIHVVDFNAWVYSGSEHLWASLVTHLYRDIEKHFGVKAHWMRLGKAIRRSLPNTLGIFAFYAVLGFALSLLLNFNEITSAADTLRLAINTIIGSIIGGSALASLPVLWAALREFSDNLLLSRANKLQTLAARPDFRNQIGIMADIKDEIKFIRKLLVKGKGGKPTRLVLFIDDLDRCEHKKAVEVLQAIMLLLADEDGSPFVIVLGIDARVIVRAIEEHYGEMLVKSGINGYEYLDKIVQLPFVIPATSQGEIDNYVDSLLWSSEYEKTVVAEKYKPILAEKPKEDVETPASIPENQFDPPKLPTAVIMQDAAKQQTESHQPEKKLEELSVTFKKDEREALKACSSDLTDNPRKIKRIVNIYRLVRMMLPEDIRIKAIRWILLTEQWPYHAAWIIEYIENDSRTKNEFRDKNLLDVYQLARKKIHATELSKLLEIDTDPYQFENFIQKEPTFTVQEIQTLLPFTFNLNPAIRSEVSKFAVKMENY